jgi:hypothetical protein
MAIVIFYSLPRIGPVAPLVRERLLPIPYLRSLSLDGVTSMNEFLPRTVVREVPPFGDVVHVVDGQANVEDAAQSPGRYQTMVVATAPAVLEFNAHWFPGWRATVDGSPTAIGPSGAAPLDDGGLIRVPVSPGQHSVELRYGRTRLRLVCDLVSLTAAAVVLALLAAAFLMRHHFQINKSPGAQGAKFWGPR